jgi:hypothetical protein
MRAHRISTVLDVAVATGTRALSVLPQRGSQALTSSMFDVEPEGALQPDPANPFQHADSALSALSAVIGQSRWSPV